MLGTGTERSLGSLITVQMELLYDDGRSVNTGFHNGVFTWGHQHLGFYFPINVRLLSQHQGCFLLQQANPCAFPTADNRWQQKHTIGVLTATTAGSSCDKGDLLQFSGTDSWVQK